jgi:DNA polymerase-3 subunit epsilon
MRQRSSWADGPLLGFDLETTGVDPESDRAVTLALIHREPGREPTRYHFLINPGIEIPETATAVHGITTDYARDHGEPPEKVWAQARELMQRLWTPQCPIVAFNGSYDLTMADRELARHFGATAGIDFTGRYLVDPLVIDRANDRWRKGGRKLTQMCQHYGVPLGEDAHDAVADTLATMRLAYKLAATYAGSVGYINLAKLHQRQIRWHRTWCENMGGWLDGEATKMQRAWSSGNVAFVRAKLNRLEITREPDDALVAATCEQTRERSRDLMVSAAQWPMRPRSLVDAMVATGSDPTTPSRAGDNPE